MILFFDLVLGVVCSSPCMSREEGTKVALLSKKGVAKEKLKGNGVGKKHIKR